MNVRLYCDRHDRVHELPAREVERLVYGLQFTAAAAQRGPAAERPEGEQDTTARVPCPLDVVVPAPAAEDFAQHVDTRVQARRTACTACDGTGDNPHPFRMVDDTVEQHDDCGHCDGSGIEPDEHQDQDAAGPRSIDNAETSTNAPTGGGR